MYKKVLSILYFQPSLSHVSILIFSLWPISLNVAR